jgi:hypothetical protein
LSFRTRLRIVILAAGFFPVATAFASDHAPSPDEFQSPSDVHALQSELGQLRAEVKELRNRLEQREQAATQQPPPAAHSIPFEAALQDAARQTEFLSVPAMTAGWTGERGFVLRSEDGDFVLSPFVLFQVRNATTLRQNAAPGGGDDTQNGFEIRRLQLGLDGNVVSPDLTYRIFWQSSELTSGNLSLLMAWVQYRFHGTPWVIGGGQFKDPLDHEQLISDARQLACDRTFVDDILAGGEAFSRGVTLRYDSGGALRAEGAFASGFNVPNTTFQQFPTNAANFGVAARGEYKVFGVWKDYDQFTTLGDQANLLVIGGGADLTEAGHTDALRHVIDIQCNLGALGLYASYLGRYTRGNTAGRGGDTYDPSVRVQGSYMFNHHWEVFGRYDYVHFDGKEFKLSTTSTVHEITAGTNYYFHGQAARATVDLTYLPNGSPLADTGNDIVQNIHHGEAVLRAQLQLML